MTYDEIDPILRKYVGSREAFRQLGFPAEELFFTIAMSVRAGVLSGFLQLESELGQYTLELGEINDTVGLQEKYEQVCLAVNSGQVSSHDLDRMYHESEPFQRKADFMMSLMVKGVRPPAMEARMRAHSPVPPGTVLKYPLNKPKGEKTQAQKKAERKKRRR
jgi:hypothetical protein